MQSGNKSLPMSEEREGGTKVLKVLSAIAPRLAATPARAAALLHFSSTGDLTNRILACLDRGDVLPLSKKFT